MSNHTGLGLADNLGAARVAAEGVKYTHEPYANGAAGVRKSLSEMGRLAREARLDAAVSGYAADVLKAAGIDGRNRSQWTARNVAQALLDNVRQVVIYAPDAVGAEVITSPAGQLCLRPGLCIRKEDCIPEGTLLLRDDYELIPIEQIKAGDRIWGKDKWTRVEATVFKGKLKVDAVDLNNSSTMYLTPDHKVYVGRCEHGAECTLARCREAHARKASYERVKVSELNVGDVLLRPDRIAFGKNETDVDKAYVEGLYLSEGWNDGDRFSISGQDGYRKEALKHEVKAICARLGISTYWNRKYIRVNDAGWAHELAPRGARARFKNASTLDLVEESAAALLRGIMSDSTSSGKRALGRTFNTTSRKLAIQTRVLQRMFGVSMSCRMMTPKEHGGAGKHPLWRMGTRARSENSSKQEWSLTVRSIERKVRKVPCWDIQTEDHYVYLPEHDVTVSNCDGLSTLLAALIMCVGFHVRIVKQSWGSGQQEHVLVAVQDEDGRWLKCDPSHASMPVGRSVTAAQEEMYDPMDANASINVGTGNAEIVTFGALPGSRRAPPARRGGAVNSQLSPRPARAAGVGRAVGLGTTTATNVRALGQQTADLMDLTNTAVQKYAAQMAPSDVQDWNGKYADWQTWYTNLGPCLSPAGPNDWIPPTVQCQLTYGYWWGDAADKMRGYKVDAYNTQARVHNAVPTFDPTKPSSDPIPAPGTPGTPGAPGTRTWVDDVKTAGIVVGGVIVVGAIAYITTEVAGAVVAVKTARRAV